MTDGLTGRHAALLQKVDLSSTRASPTTPEYLVAHSASEGRLYSHPQAQRVALAHVVVTLVGLALAIPYWKLIGLM